MEFSVSDLDQFRIKGIGTDLIEQQLKRYTTGFKYLTIVKPATLNDGILGFTEKKAIKYVTQFDNESVSKSKTKFLPASGAATRMFKTQFEYYSGISNVIDNELITFFKNIKHFAFYKDLNNALKQKNYNLDGLIKSENYKPILEILLTEQGLNYGNLPKALLKFHSYPQGERTALEEHFIEIFYYCRNSDGKSKIHLTVSPEHKDEFNKLITAVISEYENLYKIKIDISLSEQKPSTDTIAVDSENKPFRLEDGEILFRPGGHGALLENLNDIDSDIIFIKNIDNVVPERLNNITINYKKIIAAILLEYQASIFNYLKELEHPEKMDDKKLDTIADLLKKHLCIEPPPSFKNFSRENKINYFIHKLNRPIRVCGMVKNVGEPGGGPFWVKNEDGSVSLQIVESSQIDLNNQEQKDFFQNATHFNPVDLVCGVKDYKGNKFNLLKFRDDTAGFITVKSKFGRKVKAQELPGLWNGSMSNWNTVFLEVPILTFNPVKTVNDLLRKEHQPEASHVSRDIRQ
jgi:hypothetical protein